MMRGAAAPAHHPGARGAAAREIRRTGWNPRTVRSARFVGDLPELQAEHRAFSPWVQMDETSVALCFVEVFGRRLGPAEVALAEALARRAGELGGRPAAAGA